MEDHVLGDDWRRESAERVADIRRRRNMSEATQTTDPENPPKGARAPVEPDEWDFDDDEVEAAEAGTEEDAVDEDLVPEEPDDEAVEAATDEPEDRPEIRGSEAYERVQERVLAALDAHFDDVKKGAYSAGKAGKLRIEVVVSPSKGVTVTPKPDIPVKTEKLELRGKIEAGQGPDHPNLVLFD